MLGNVAYCLVSMAVLVGIALLAVATGTHEAVTVFLVLVLGISAIALRINIFNRYAFSVQRIGVSPQGDLEWPGGWMAHETVARIEVQRAAPQPRGYKIACLSHSGESHDLGRGLTQARAEAICRDLHAALKASTPGMQPEAHEPALKTAQAGRHR